MTQDRRRRHHTAAYLLGQLLTRAGDNRHDSLATLVSRAVTLADALEAELRSDGDGE